MKKCALYIERRVMELIKTKIIINMTREIIIETESGKVQN